MTPTEVERLLRPLQLKDLRSLCRARGLNPAGGTEQLQDRLKEHMLSTGNFSLHANGDSGMEQSVPQGYAVAPQGYLQYTTGVNSNNYSRPGGQQNVGNFITDRPSSHVSAPPGGRSTLQLGGYPEAPQQQQYQPPPQAPYATSVQQQQASPGNAYGATSYDARTGSLANNYSRPGGQQNVGNFITDRPSSRVLAPPGGGSQIAFGDYNLPPPGPANYTAPPPASYTAPYGSSVQPQQYSGMQQQAPHGYGSPGPDGRGPPAGAKSAEAGHGYMSNNYSRPAGQQNVGNFITDRPTSRVTAPPGGKSQITFG